MDIVWTKLIAVCVLYCVAAGLMYVLQRGLLYPGSDVPGPPAEYGLSDVEEVRIRTADGLDLLAWWQEPAPGKPVVLYWHGNGGSLAARAQKFEAFGEHGYGLLMMAYRGYSGNPGKPSQPAMIEDAVRAAEWLGERTDAPVIYYGESLGSTVAMQLARRIQPRAIIMEGGFDSAAALAQQRYPIFPAALLIKDPWDSLAIAGEINVPVLMVHAVNDKVVPISHGERLFQALSEPKKFIHIADGNHVDLFDYGADRHVLTWLAAQGL
jgi:fermentation-respiration switch protein FrsA (DUF1100 family)